MMKSRGSRCLYCPTPNREDLYQRSTSNRRFTESTLTFTSVFLTASIASGLRSCFFLLLLLLVVNYSSIFALFRHTLPYFVIPSPISSYLALLHHTLPYFVILCPILLYVALFFHILPYCIYIHAFINPTLVHFHLYLHLLLIQSALPFPLLF